MWTIHFFCWELNVEINIQQKSLFLLNVNKYALQIIFTIAIAEVEIKSVKLS